MNENTRLRYSNAVFMNDPDEGKIFIDCLEYLELISSKTKSTKNTSTIKEAFYNVLKEEKNNFYLGSFLPLIDGHEDELLMWRTYGKDENQNEAAGCCLVIDTLFFDKEDGGNITLGKDKPSSATHPLYSVLYYNQRTHQFVGKNSKELDDNIRELIVALQNLLAMRKKGNSIGNKIHNKSIEKVLYHTLSELRYFFKSADYAYENELRVIQFATDKNSVKIDNSNGTIPRKVFIESSKEIKSHLKKIVLGPMVSHPERWMYLEKKMNDDGYSLEMTHSSCHFQ